jgi:glycosyltransferase 2 family protein
MSKFLKSYKLWIGLIVSVVCLYLAFNHLFIPRKHYNLHHQINVDTFELWINADSGFVVDDDLDDAEKKIYGSVSKTELATFDSDTGEESSGEFVRVPFSAFVLSPSIGQLVFLKQLPQESIAAVLFRTVDNAKSYVINGINKDSGLSQPPLLIKLGEHEGLRVRYERTGWQEALEAAADFNWKFLWLSLLWAALGFVARGFRFWVFTLPMKKPGFMNVCSSMMIGFMVNNILPLRVGEAARGILFAKKEDIKISSSFALVFLERFFDLVAIVIFLLLGLTLIPPESFSDPTIAGSVGKARALFAYMIGFFVVFIFMLVFATKFVLKITEVVLKGMMFFLHQDTREKYAGRIVGVVESFTGGLKVVRDPKLLISSVLLSLVTWFFILLSIDFIARGFGFYAANSLSLTNMIVVMILITIGVMIPASPGYIGTFELFAIKGLLLFSVMESAAASFAVLLHFSQIIPVTFVGFLFLIRENISLSGLTSGSELKKDEHQEESS